MYQESVAEKLYTDMPDTSFTRTISNPEVVMRRRRQQKLEKKLQEIRSKDDQGLYFKVLYKKQISLRDKSIFTSRMGGGIFLTGSGCAGVIVEYDLWPWTSGVITDGDIGESPMKWMGDIREIFAGSRCHFKKKYFKKNMIFTLYFVSFGDSGDEF